MASRTLSSMSLMVVAATAACSDSGPPVAPPVAPAISFARGGNGDNNGRIVFASDRDTPGEYEVYSMNPDGSDVTRLTTSPGFDAIAAWSPDGKRIVFVSGRHDSLLELYVMNADGSAVTRLTTSPGLDAFPSWSKDGKRIVFASTRNSGVPDDGSLQSLDIYTMNADGTGITRLTSSPSGELTPSWSPDGKRIAFAREGATPMIAEIMTMNTDGSGVTQLTFEGALSVTPAWSPGGKQIAFVNEHGLYIMNADGTGLTLIVPGPDLQYPSWSDDGKSLAYAAGPSGQEDVYTVRADGTGITRLTFNPGTDGAPSWRR